MKRRVGDLYSRIKLHWRSILIFGLSGLLGLTIIGQFLYPSDRMLPFATLDNLRVSGWQKNDAIKLLDDKYQEKQIPIYFGTIKKAYRSPKPIEIGLTISNKTRINDLGYPWYLRIIPTSILWAHFVINPDSKPAYRRNDAVLTAYIDKELGGSCNVKPTDASLKVSGVVFEVIPSQNGGVCDINNVHQILSSTGPRLTNSDVKVSVKEIPPTITGAMAMQFGDQLKAKLANGVIISVAGTSQTIASTQLFSWLDISNAGSQLAYSFNTDRAASYLDQQFAAKVAVSPGTTTIYTYNFTQTRQEVGASGKKLDVVGTLDNMKSFLDGDASLTTVVTVPVAPLIAYVRDYSPTDVGLSALMQQYAEEHPGVFGVSLVELSGQNRRAAYNDTKIFTTASTYKLFVAYSTLKRIESGAWSWTDQITSTKNVSVCFDDMIIRSDNDCGAALLAKVGYTNITNEVHAIGCANTSFLGNDSIKTTAADLTTLLAQLQNGQILSQQTNRDRLINDMKQNIYRQGIPAGISGSTVADKVGFLDSLLHDAAIIYSPTGTYVLAIMTDGSSWATIADLAGKIEALRSQ